MSVSGCIRLRNRMSSCEQEDGDKIRKCTRFSTWLVSNEACQSPENAWCPRNWDVNCMCERGFGQNSFSHTPNTQIVTFGCFGAKSLISSSEMRWKLANDEIHQNRWRTAAQLLCHAFCMQTRLLIILHLMITFNPVNIQILSLWLPFCARSSHTKWQREKIVFRTKMPARYNYRWVCLSFFFGFVHTNRIPFSVQLVWLLLSVHNQVCVFKTSRELWTRVRGKRGIQCVRLSCACESFDNMFSPVITPFCIQRLSYHRLAVLFSLEQ